MIHKIISYEYGWVVAVISNYRENTVSRAKLVYYNGLVADYEFEHTNYADKTMEFERLSVTIINKERPEQLRKLDLPK